MDRAYPYSRRLVRRTQLHKRLAALAAVAVAGCAVLYALTLRTPASAPPSLAVAAAHGPAPDEASMQARKPGQRRIYPYSIVPGGVADVRELGRVIREDKVVAAHYAEFDLSRAQVKTVTAPRAVHVSYRKGDKVYWTAKKVMLAEGETLLSDGTHEARARCANQISDTPRLPVEAHGPSAEELDSSVVENDPASQDGFENVSAGMLDGEGVPGGFLNAPGTGSAGGILAGGGAMASGSPMSLTANGPAPAGAFLSSRSGGTRGAPGNTGNESASGDSGGESGGTPNASAPATGAPDGGAPGASLPTPDPAAPQPFIPSTPTGDGPAAPGATPATPSRPDPSSPALPALPGGGESGGGGDGIPTQPPATIGANPVPGGPDSSPVPEPTLNPPKEPVRPEPQPDKPADIPEPGTGWLMGAALAPLLLLRARRRRAVKLES